MMSGNRGGSKAAPSIFCDVERLVQCGLGAFSLLTIPGAKAMPRSFWQYHACVLESARGQGHAQVLAMAHHAIERVAVQTFCLSESRTSPGLGDLIKGCVLYHPSKKAAVASYR